MELTKFEKNGFYLMLALDHRESIRRLLNPTNPEEVSSQDIIELKRKIIEAVIADCSGLLIDEQYGLKAYSQRSKPFLLPLEKTGYTEKDGERITEIEFSVSQIKEMGAEGAKLLLYFNPDLKSSKVQLHTGRQMVLECRKEKMPLFLEIVIYDPYNSKNLDQKRAHLILDSLRMFLDAEVIPDVFKLEYPGDFKSCQKITEILGKISWILLTRGDTFDLFKLEYMDAVRAGARGFLAGRALWQEACKLQGEEQAKFLKYTLPERFQTLVQLSQP